VGRFPRTTVRKVIRSGATEFSYERSVQPQPKIGPWRDELDRMLAENVRRPKRERLTRIRMFEELRALGYEGGYDAVRRYAAAWSKSEAEASAAAYVPLSFDPGEAFQFDWSHEIAIIDGVTTTIKVAPSRQHGFAMRLPGYACPALPQPDGVCPRLSAGDAGASPLSLGPMTLPMARCSTPTTRRSPSSVARAPEGSTTT